MSSIYVNCVASQRAGVMFRCSEEVISKDDLEKEAWDGALDNLT